MKINIKKLIKYFVVVILACLATACFSIYNLPPFGILIVVLAGGFLAWIEKEKKLNKCEHKWEGIGIDNSFSESVVGNIYWCVLCGALKLKIEDDDGERDAEEIRFPLNTIKDKEKI